MKTFLLFLIFCSSFFSCSRKSSHPEFSQATGHLYFSTPAADGAGLYFFTDSGMNAHQEFIYFYDDTGDQFQNDDRFKDSIGLHLRMTFLDEGRRGCPFCQVTPAIQQRIVKLISLVKE